MPIWVYWYNYVTRHWSNWRIRQMWRADPDRPSICPQGARITPEVLEWAKKSLIKRAQWDALR